MLPSSFQHFLDRYPNGVTERRTIIAALQDEHDRHIGAIQDAPDHAADPLVGHPETMTSSGENRRTTPGRMSWYTVR